MILNINRLFQLHKKLSFENRKTAKKQQKKLKTKIFFCLEKIYGTMMKIVYIKLRVYFLPSRKEGSINRINPATFCAYHKLGHGFPMPYVVVFFV